MTSSIFFPSNFIMDNDKYYRKFLKYKNKYTKLRKQSDNMNGGSKSIKVGCALLHEINGMDHVLMIQDKDKQWKLPYDYISKNEKESDDKMLGDVFKKVTHINLPEINGPQIFQNGGNKIITGKINHIDTNQFKSSDYAQNIGFISLPMLKKYNYFPSKSVSVNPQISDILQSMEDDGLL